MGGRGGGAGGGGESRCFDAPEQKNLMRCLDDGDAERHPEQTNFFVGPT